MSEKLSVFLEKAQRYCSSAEQCIYTVKKKMHEWGVDDDEKDYIIPPLPTDLSTKDGMPWLLPEANSGCWGGDEIKSDTI